MPTIHFFGGEKGGIGKSFVCCAAISYLQKRQLPFALFDCDRSNPDVKRMHSDLCQFAVISEDVDHEGKADRILEAGLEKRVLVNLPAQSFIALKKWFIENSLLELPEDVDLQFRLWFVTDGGFDSISLLSNSLHFFQGKVPHLLIKNYGVNRNWNSLASNPEVQALTDKYQVSHMDFPRMSGVNNNDKINQLSLSFSEALTSKALSFGERQRVSTFLKESGKVFERANAF